MGIFVYSLVYYHNYDCVTVNFVVFSIMGTFEWRCRWMGEIYNSDKVVLDDGSCLAFMT